MSRLVKIAKKNDVAPGTGKVVAAEGCTLALFNVAGTLYAIDNCCPHESGPLGEGEVNGEVVTCPWHSAEFNVKTGAVLCPPAYENVRRFPVKIEGDDVLVEVD